MSFLFAEFVFDRHHALAFADPVEFDKPRNLCEHARIFRLARFEEFGNARETAGDIARFCGDFRKPRKRNARGDLLFVVDVEDGARRQVVASEFVARFVGDEDARLLYVQVQVGDDAFDISRLHIVPLFKRRSDDDVFEVHIAVAFSDDRFAERIKFSDRFSRCDDVARFDVDRRTVRDFDFYFAARQIDHIADDHNLRVGGRFYVPAFRRHDDAAL